MANKKAYSVKKVEGGCVVWNNLVLTAATKTVTSERADELCAKYNDLHNERIDLLQSIEVNQSVTVRMWNGSTDAMSAIGYGKYPYDCKAKDKRPNDMVFFSQQTNSWTSAWNMLSVESFIEVNRN